MEPAMVQIILWDCHTVQASPPTGAVKVKLPAILKLALEVPLTVVSALSVTLTFTVEDMASGIVQEYGVPKVASTEGLITTVCNPSLKPSVEYSNLTVEMVPVLVQVIF